MWFAQTSNVFIGHSVQLMSFSGTTAQTDTQSVAQLPLLIVGPGAKQA